MAQVVFTSIWNAMYLSPGKAYTYIIIYAELQNKKRLKDKGTPKRYL